MEKWQSHWKVLIGMIINRLLRNTNVSYWIAGKWSPSVHQCWWCALHNLTTTTGTLCTVWKKKDDQGERRKWVDGHFGDELVCCGPTHLRHHHTLPVVRHKLSLWLLLVDGQSYYKHSIALNWLCHWASGPNKSVEIWVRLNQLFALYRCRQQRGVIKKHEKKYRFR